MSQSFHMAGLVFFATSPRTDILQSPSFISHRVGANIAGNGEGDCWRARQTGRESGAIPGANRNRGGGRGR